MKRHIKYLRNKILTRTNILLILIVLFALAIRLNYFLGLNLNDDLVYVNLAHDIISGRFRPNGWIFAVRHAINFSIAAFFFLFGVSDFTAGLYPLFTSIGSIIVAFLIGKEMFNKDVGLLAAFLLSFFPVDAIYSTTVVPDVPVAFFMGLSVLFFVKGELLNKKRMIYYFFSGISIGLAWLVKSLGILILIFYLCYFLADKILKIRLYPKKGDEQRFGIRNGYLMVAAGLLAVFILEGLLYQLTLNNFLQRFDTEIGHYTPELLGVNTDLTYYPRALFNENTPAFSYIGFFFYFVIIGTFFILHKKDKRALVLLIWLLSLLLFMQYGTMNPLRFTLMQRIYRFLNVITIPSVLIISYSLLCNKLKLKNVLAFISIALLLVTSLYYIDAIAFYMDQSMIDFREAASFIESHPEKKVYSDPDTIGKLDFLTSYKKTQLLKNIEGVESPEEIKDSYIIVDASRGYVEVPDLKSSLPSFLFNPPSNWVLVKTIKDSTIDYYRTYDTKIYYVE